eukprot:Colp12_sorted_trinity150504_noHs@35990
MFSALNVARRQPVRAVAASVMDATQARDMATLKEIKIRLTSVKSIQKITKSMKMVSAAKFARAERELKKARVFGNAATSLYEKAELKAEADETRPNQVMVLVSSDRGLCGAIHSSVGKAVRHELAATKPGINTKLVCVGDKIRTLLQRTYADKILLDVRDVGKKPPTYAEAAAIADQLISSGFDYDSGYIVFNEFKSAIAYETVKKPIFSLKTIQNAEELKKYEVEGDILQSYQEFTFGTALFHAMCESAASEQSARMTAMDNASKNAGEMIDKLNLTYNRTRQAVITTELIEIISGAAALE